MKLYYMPGACPLAAHIVLEWIGAPFEITEVKREALRSPEYLRLNPAGVVPTLVDGDFVLSENIAILHYLADLHPEARLAGDDNPRGRAKVNHWLGYLNSDVHQSFKPLFAPQRYIGDSSMNEDLASHAKARLHGLFAVVDTPLTRHDWLADSGRSIADPYLFVMLRWAKGKEVDLKGMQGLDGFFARMQADPGVKAAEHAQGL